MMPGATEAPKAAQLQSGVSRKRGRMPRDSDYVHTMEHVASGDAPESSKMARLRARVTRFQSGSAIDASNRSEAVEAICDISATLQMLVNVMDRRLEALGDGSRGNWPRWFLKEALCRKADVESLLRFLPYLLVEVERMSPLRQPELLLPAIRAYGRFNMLASINAMLEQFLRQRSTHTKTAVDSSGAYPLLPLVKALVSVGKITNESSIVVSSLSTHHRAVISRLILRLTLQYLSIPSQGHLPKEIHPVLLSSSSLTPSLRRILLDDAQARKLRLPKLQERAALTAAVRERDKEGALRLWISMNSQSDFTGVDPSDLDQSQMLGVLMLAWAHGSYASVASAAADLKLLGDADVDADVREWQPRDAGERADPKRVAWSMKAARAAVDQSKDAKYLMRMSMRVPAGQMDRRTLTSILRGLLLRKDFVRAWQLWEAMVEREKRRIEAHSKVAEVDHVAVTVMADGLGMQGRVEEAITLVDSWARRPWQTPESAKGTDRTIVVDTQTANILLLACGTARRGRMAFRIWQAMLPRWGVYHDSISLTLLLQAANVQQTSIGRRGILAEGREILSDGFHELSTSFRSESSHATADINYEAYEASGFAKGSVSVFLDSDDIGYKSSRRATYDSRRRARSLFRSILFTNWPDLEATKSPLNPAGAWSAFSSIMLSSSHQSSASSIVLSKPPTPDARYTHIIPAASAFNAYISVLDALEAWTEIPLVFVWMKALSVVPSWHTMRKALLIVSEAAGPRRYINGRWLRDEEVLREWLHDWVGEELGRDVPTVDDLAAVVRARSASAPRS